MRCSNERVTMQPRKRDSEEHPAVTRVLDYSFLYAWGLIGGFVLVVLPGITELDGLRGILGAVWAVGTLVAFDHGRREEAKATVLFGQTCKQIVSSGYFSKATLSVVAFGLSLQALAWFTGYVALLLYFGGLVLALGLPWLHYRTLDRQGL